MTFKNRLKIAINGFGRIGRTVLRAYLMRPQDFDSIELVAINDKASPEALLHLLRYDSTHGRLSATGYEAGLHPTQEALWLKNHAHQHLIALSCQHDPRQLNWSALGVDIVLECTGQFREYAQANWHRLSGAKQVIIGAAPFDEVDASIVMGVNDHLLNRSLGIISSVSCTTQALTPLLWLLDDVYGIRSAMMSEIHAVTADQSVLDSAHRDFRRARASGYNIIPTTSSSIAATIRVLPQMAGKLAGHSLRVPTLDVAAIDVNLVLKQKPSLQVLNDTLKHASQSKLKGILGYSDEPLVSSDFIHDTHSLVIDSLQSMQVGEQFKIFAWYDNEWGYANRLLEMCQKLADC